MPPPSAKAPHTGPLPRAEAHGVSPWLQSARSVFVGCEFHVARCKGDVFVNLATKVAVWLLRNQAFRLALDTHALPKCGPNIASQVLVFCPRGGGGGGGKGFD